MAVKPDFIDLLNQTVKCEFQVKVQYFLQNDKIEKVIKKQMTEDIFDKTTHDAIGILIQEMKMKIASANGLICEVEE
ncbi:MAG: hypothetical protein ABSF65_11585 [Candidatus Bathyarchaeia archaeon]|jgi:hypothetical protein